MLRQIQVFPNDAKARRIEATRLIEAAFAREGGFESALTGVLRGHDGGVRTVMSKVIEQIKVERREEYVRGVLSGLAQPFDGKSRLELTRAFLLECPELTAAGSDFMEPEKLALRLESLILRLLALRARIRRAVSP